jgi:hypothetical protein
MAAHDREPGARLYPRWLDACYSVWDFITWPRTAWQLKRGGFRRTGWMTWEFGSADWSDNDGWEDDPSPACYRAPIGFMVHGPGCTCPEERRT